MAEFFMCQLTVTKKRQIKNSSTHIIYVSIYVVFMFWVYGPSKFEPINMSPPFVSASFSFPLSFFFFMHWLCNFFQVKSLYCMDFPRIVSSLVQRSSIWPNGVYHSCESCLVTFWLFCAWKYKLFALVNQNTNKVEITNVWPSLMIM